MCFQTLLTRQMSESTTADVVGCAFRHTGAPLRRRGGGRGVLVHGVRATYAPMYAMRTRACVMRIRRASSCSRHAWRRVVMHMPRVRHTSRHAYATRTSCVASCIRHAYVTRHRGITPLRRHVHRRLLTVTAFTSSSCGAAYISAMPHRAFGLDRSATRGCTDCYMDVHNT